MFCFRLRRNLLRYAFDCKEFSAATIRATKETFSSLENARLNSCRRLRQQIDSTEFGLERIRTRSRLLDAIKGVSTVNRNTSSASAETL
jgi:hypothetical protein